MIQQMILITYVLSFLYGSESGAQNGIILLNFLLGALGSIIILMLRSLNNLGNAAKILQYILSLLPSFDFDFGCSLLLNKMMMLIAEYPTTYYSMNDSVFIEKFDLILSCVVFIATEILVILFFIEFFFYFSLSVNDAKISSEINDSQV